MALLEPQNDPISFMDFLASAKRTSGIMMYPAEMSWSEAKSIMTEAFNELIEFDNYFMIMLGNESLLTNSSADFVILTENEVDRLKAEAFMFNFKVQWPKN